MKEKVRLLTISDLAVSTGFSRVMTEVITNLPDYFDVHSMAINYFGDPHTMKASLYPASAGGDLYGINRLSNLLKAIEPDYIFILQDSWIVKEYLKIIPEEDLKKVVIYTPVDAGPYMPTWVEKFSDVKHICVYTEFGKKVILAANPKIENITVVPHGINTDMFYPRDMYECREELGKIDEDAFIILNVNRNQPRKKIDICMKAFGFFAKDKPDVRYYHHAGVEDAGWNVIELAKRYGFEKRLILSSRDLSPQRSVSDNTLNTIYNVSNVGLNLSSGEGWGLCFGKDTNVLTTTGFKKIQNVGINDSVFDANGGVTTVKDTLVREWDDTIYNIKLSGLTEPIQVTEEHPFFTEEGFVEAKNLTTASYILKPDLTEFESFSKIDLTHYADFIHDDKYIYFKNIRGRLGSKIKRSELQRVRKLFNSNVKIGSVRRIDRFLRLDKKVLPILFYFLTSKNRVRHFAYSEELRETFKDIFGYTKKETKVINLGTSLKLALMRIAFKQVTYLSLNRELITELLYRLINTSSYMHPTSGSLFLSSSTESKSRIYRIMLLKLGIASSEFRIKDGTLYISVDKRHLPRFLSSKSNRNRREDINGFYYRVMSIEEVPYKGKVYNLETESHTYNVYGYAVHNCNMEHSITGKAQIISANSANLELYTDDRGILVPLNHYETNPKILTEGGVVSLEHSVAALNYAYSNREAIKEIGTRARNYFLQDKFKWSNISNTFREIIES